MNRMLLKFVFIFTIFLLINTIFAETKDDFKKANDYYRQNKFSEAIKIYNDILKTGTSNYAIYYNLGNAYYKDGQLGYAILFYEKAYKINPKDEDLQMNMLLARNKQADKIDIIPEFFLYSWWNYLKNIFTINGWSIVALIMLVLSLILLSNLVIFRKIYLIKTNLFLFALSCLLFLFSVSFVVIKSIEFNDNQKAIVVKKSVNVKTSPNETSSDYFVIHEGLKIKIEDKLENWGKVRLEDGKTGWLLLNEIETI